MRLEVRDAAVGYGGAHVLSGVSFRLESGQVGCLLGPSGSGKTTLLRAIAGFEPLAHGTVEADGELLSGPGRHLPAERRRIGMVFQEHALLPHLDVRGNVGFGLYAWPRAAAAARVDEMLALVGLAGEAGRFPHQLSGGQQQRVALARALAPSPRLVLFDEPFASLDPELRERLAGDVREALQRTGTSALLVTHSQSEAFAMADVIGLVGEGRLQQWGDAAALYEAPATRFVARFVGRGALLAGEALPGGRARCAAGEVALRGPAPAPGAALDLLLRPEHVRLAAGGAMSARVVSRRFQGGDFLCALRLDGGESLECRVARAVAPAEGERVRFELVGPVPAFA